MNEKKRKPIIAAICSLVEPGLGFTYNGNFKLATIVTCGRVILLWLLVFFGIDRSYALSVVFFMLEISFRLCAAIVNAVHAKESAQFILKRFNRWFVYGAFILVPLLLRFVFYLSKPVFPTRAYIISAPSMEPTLREGEAIFADMIYYSKNPVRPGDVVVFHWDTVVRYPFDTVSTWIKRVIAVEGQEVRIKDGIPFVDNELSPPALVPKRSSQEIKPPSLKDPYIYPRDAGNEDQYGPVIVPKGHYFLLGDNRDKSLDSRHNGFVGKRAILGKVLYIFWSNDFERIGESVN
ncbi:MAG: signal peptidase I [Bacteroidota bacterium]|jgi:signal peptidase I